VAAVIYVEYIERDRSMPVEIFRQLGDQETSWVEGALDRMILQIGRTMRLGPRQSYLCFWNIAGFARLDAWETYFHSAEYGGNRRSRAMHRAIHIQRAGLYDALRQDPDIRAPLYVVEYSDSGGAKSNRLQDIFAERSEQHRAVRHLLLLRRIGLLGPEPEVLSIWGAPSYAAAETFLRAATPGELKIADLGLYRPFGEEIL
jgi:hypothetical protein